MKLFQRFAFYGIGLIIGSVFVYFIWEKKNVQFDYLPNSRVLKDIRSDKRFFSDEASESMKTIGLDSIDIAFILQHGDVDFKNSEPRKKPCKKYIVNGLLKDKNVSLVIEKCDSISTIERILVN